jgi:hypothetical protein
LHLTIKNKPLPPASITIALVSNTCSNRIYRYTAPALTAETAGNVAASGYNWTMPTGPVGSTGVLDSGTLASRVIRIKYSSNSAASSLDSIRVAFTSSCGNSLYKAVKLSNLKRTGCGGRRIASDGSEVEIAVNAFPNPTRDEFSVSISNLEEHTQVMYVVFDNNGRLIENGSFPSESILSIGKEYSPGLYYLVATIGDERKYVRLIKF